jgi:hypothetical protein
MIYVVRGLFDCKRGVDNRFEEVFQGIICDPAVRSFAKSDRRRYDVFSGNEGGRRYGLQRKMLS